MLNLNYGPNGEKYLESVNGGNVDSDWCHLQKYNNSLKQTQAKYQLDLNLYPEPFAGNANALVYILSGNPGLAPNNQDFDLMKSNGQNWEDMMLNSYNPFPNTATGHNPTLYWLDPNLSPNLNPNSQIQPVNGKNKNYTGGFGWWEPRTRRLRAELAKRGIGNLHERLFNIDYHPYHSKNLKINQNIQDLPSKKKEVDDILKRALNNPDRLFIIVRCRKLWEDRLKNILGIPQTSPFPNQQYPNVIMLKNPRCAYLTKNNMIINNTRNDWNRLVDTLTK